MREAAGTGAGPGYPSVVGQPATTKPGGRPRKSNAARRGWRLHVDLEPAYRRRVQERLSEMGNPPMASFIRRCLDWGLRHEFDGQDTFNVRIKPARDEKVAKALKLLAVQQAAGCKAAMEMEDDPKSQEVLRSQGAAWLDVAGWCEDLIDECERFRRRQDQGRTRKASHQNFHPDVDAVPENLHSS